VRESKVSLSESILYMVEPFEGGTWTAGSVKSLLRRFDEKKGDFLEDNLDGDYYRSGSKEAKRLEKKRDMASSLGSCDSESPETDGTSAKKISRSTKGRAHVHSDERHSERSQQMIEDVLGELPRNLFSGARIGNIENFHVHVHFDRKHK
jgi:hypothetical protein